jgi:hypothetical protein
MILKILKTVGKNLQSSRVQFGRYAFLNVFSIQKPLSSEGRFHLRKEKNAIKKLG